MWLLYRLPRWCALHPALVPLWRHRLALLHFCDAVGFHTRLLREPLPTHAARIAEDAAVTGPTLSAARYLSCRHLSISFYTLFSSSLCQSPNPLTMFVCATGPAKTINTADCLLAALGPLVCRGPTCPRSRASFAAHQSSPSFLPFGRCWRCRRMQTPPPWGAAGCVSARKTRGNRLAHVTRPVRCRRRLRHASLLCAFVALLPSSLSLLSRLH